MQISWRKWITFLGCCIGASAVIVIMLSTLGAGKAWGAAQGTGSNVLVQAALISTDCPVSTPEPPPIVEPMISPTNLFTQTITVYYHRSEAITVTCESGVFAMQAGDEDWSEPARVKIRLLRNLVHHLRVETRVSEYYIGGCYYSSYTMDTVTDLNGNPLVIEQVSPSMGYRFFLPLFKRADVMLG